MPTKAVFLGGTCGENNWRDGFISRLVARGVPNGKLFNPVVKNWDSTSQLLEDAMKADRDVVQLYYIGDSHEHSSFENKEGEQGNYFLSFYSLHEATMGLYDAPERTVVVFDVAGLAPRAVKRLLKVCKDLRARFPTAPIFTSLAESEQWIADRFAIKRVA